MKLVFSTANVSVWKTIETTMKERINRKTDENLYQPKIHSERIRELYALKFITGLPMTVLVDLAIQDFVERKTQTQKTFTANMIQESEPQKESIQKNCSYCGPGFKATWELVTDEGEVFVCDDHHFILREIRVVGLERQIGQEKWIEVQDFNNQDRDEELFEDLGEWKSLINYEDS